MKYMLVKLTSPSVTTFIVGEFTTTSGQNSSFHVHMNFTITRVAIAGFTAGRITRQKIPSSPAPSMRAAST